MSSVKYYPASENDEILDQMKDLGYNSHDSVFNLGTIGVFTFIYWLRVVFYLFGTKLYIPRYNKGHEYFRKLGKSLFWGEFLFLAMEAYFEFLISGYLNLSEPSSATSGDFMATTLGLYSVVVCLVIVPGVFYYVLKKSHEIINEEDFHRKWKGLYDGVKTKRKAPMLFYPIFCARRLLFCIIAFGMWEIPA